jgi:hypothetical protein
MQRAAFKEPLPGKAFGTHVDVRSWHKADQIARSRQRQLLTHSGHGPARSDLEPH